MTETGRSWSFCYTSDGMNFWRMCVLLEASLPSFAANPFGRDPLFSFSFFRVPSGARAHRKPCGLAPKGARGFARVAWRIRTCARATAETQGAKRSPLSAPDGRPSLWYFLLAAQEKVLVV